MRIDETGRISISSADSPLPSISCPTFNIKMDCRQVEVVEGQFVRIGCQLSFGKFIHIFYQPSTLSDAPTIEVLWYNEYRQIKDSPRTPIRNYTTDSLLEIFDCSVAADSGEIICLAISETGIVSDVCRLSIKGFIQL